MKIFQTKIEDNHIQEISKVLKIGQLGFGPNVELFERKYSSYSNKKFNIATNSASASAFMIFSYLKDKYGTCDVYTTSLGFTSPAWAAKHHGHNLIFVDVNNDLQFSSEHYKQVRKKNKNQNVVMPVLYGGVSTIDDFNLYGDEVVVVDSAHCATPTIKSDFVFFSFHPYKPICTSDGGMISTDDYEASEYFQKYRNFGRMKNGVTYDIVQNGFKFYMNNLNASIGLTQLENYNQRVEDRKKIFSSLNKKYDLLQHDEKSSYYFATTLISNADEVIKKYNISRHYPMLHKTSYFKNKQILPVLENLHEKILNIPLTGEWT